MIKAIVTRQFELDQSTLNSWAIENVPNYTAQRWQDAPIVIDGVEYISLDERVLSCPICIDVIEIELPIIIEE